MKRNRNRTSALVAAVSLLASLVATTPAVADPAATVVVAKEFMFSPATLTVTAGTTVTWSNLDEEPHTVVSDTGLFRSPAMDTHESFSFTFDKPGTYRFVCSIHPQMTGTIIVK
jgi:plastocyanin